MTQPGTGYELELCKTIFLRDLGLTQQGNYVVTLPFDIWLWNSDPEAEPFHGFGWLNILVAH